MVFSYRGIQGSLFFKSVLKACMMIGILDGLLSLSRLLCIIWAPCPRPRSIPRLVQWEAHREEQHKGRVFFVWFGLVCLLSF